MTRQGAARGLAVLFGFLVLVAGCSQAPPPTAAAGPRSMNDLVFLTRDGCVNTETMRANLDEALTALGWSNDYQFIDADTLKPSDPRGGYGTPTVLNAGRDLFGMPEPAVPHPAPTWRLYQGGVPSTADIKEKLPERLDP